MKEVELNKQERSLFVPFIIGGVIGAGLALLFAPKSGRDMRKQIKDLATDAQGAVSSAVDRGKELYDEGKVALKSAIEAGKEAYHEEREKHLKAA
jgi:gas vesicle protein